MVHDRQRNGFAYALCEGVARSSGRHGLGVVIKDAQHHRLWSAVEVSGELPPARARFAAIAETLRTSRRLGIDRIRVYCHDRSVVGQINHRESMTDETRAGGLEVRALLNTFRHAEVVSLPWVANLEAIWLARQAAAGSGAQASGRQPALPLAAGER